MGQAIRLTLGGILFSLGVAILFGVPDPSIANVPWPVVGIVSTAVGLALVISGFERVVAERREQTRNLDARKLRTQLIGLRKQERLADHDHWLAVEQVRKAVTGADRKKAEAVVLKRDTKLTKIRAQIAATEAYIGIAEGNSGPAKDAAV